MDTSQTDLFGTRHISPARGIGSLFARATLLVWVLVCVACSSTPDRSSPSERPTSGPRDVSAPETASRASGEFRLLAQVAQTARSQLGAPYHYGGETPRGFDCSGLVFYSYGESGVRVPRTSDEQLHAVRTLSLEQAMPGDLVFFRTRQKGLHVGIYLGDQRFVHAPATGKTVVINELDQDYYRRHLIRIGRIY
jgi:cell wall-associated NlpC family hydrolase